MKIQTSNLTGPALDWVVAKCENVPNIHTVQKPGKTCVYGQIIEIDFPYQPSTDWSQGGPIIERERFAVDYYPDGGHPDGGEWLVTSLAYETDAGIPLYEGFGPTPLIAAMRCFVASKLGDEVEIPDNLA